MWRCKHCNKDFDFDRTTDKANHSRWCDENPKAKLFKENNAERAKIAADNKFGELITFRVTCSTCSTKFEVEERENLFPSKQHYYCSRSCSNSVGGTAKALKYHPDEIAHYKAVLLRYHKHKCLVCGFDKIIDAHHVDENHDNNDPKNLVPICSNHHRMFHSRFRSEIEPKITEYIKERWK